MFSLDPELNPGIERFLLSLTTLALAVAALVGADNYLLFTEGFASLTLLFWFWLFVLYIAVAIPLIFIVNVVHRKKAYGLTIFAAINAGLFAWILVIIGLEYPRETLLSTPYYGTELAAGIALVLAGLSGIFWYETRRIVVRSLYLVALTVLLVMILSGGGRDSRGLRSVVEQSHPVNASETPLVVIGLDGADWDYVNPLIESGRLPNLERLRDRGSWGNLSTIRPTKSPVLWTTMATGTHYTEHSINAFVGFRIFGSNQLFPLPKLPRGTGLKTLFPYIVQGTDPLNNTHRRRYTYWEIASAFDRPVSVLNWWMTWPANPFRGQMITERIHFRGFGYTRIPDETRLTYPPELLEPSLSRMYRPGDVGYEDWTDYLDVSRSAYQRLSQREFKHHDLAGEFPFLVSMLESNSRLAEFLIERGDLDFERTPDLMVLFRGTDLAGHMGLRYSDLVEKPPGVSEAVRSKFGGFVSNVYTRVDRVLGEILRRYKDPNIVVVSDHGFERLEEGKTVKFGHERAPDGIWLASGPAFRNDYRGPLDIYQVLPLLLRAKGLPVAGDLPGSVPAEILEGPSAGAESTGSVESYGVRFPSDRRSGGSRTNRKIKEHLEGLGYL